MKPIELVGHVDAEHRLHVDLSADIPPGPVKVTLQPATEEDDWRALIKSILGQGLERPARGHLHD